MHLPPIAAASLCIPAAKTIVCQAVTFAAAFEFASVGVGG